MSNTKNDNVEAAYSSAWLAPCWCGGKAVGRGRTLTCSKRKCGTFIMRKTRAESVRRWNEIFALTSE